MADGLIWHFNTTHSKTCNASFNTMPLNALFADEYQCCGSLEVDFPEVCALLGMNRIPVVTTQPKASSPTAESSPTGRCRSQKQVRNTNKALFIYYSRCCSCIVLILHSATL